jgi:Uncharacterised nucleotidyltransferase
MGTRNELCGSFWPSERQKLLLRAALGEGDRSANAWLRLRPSFDLDRLESSSYVLLPLLYEQLNKLGIEDQLLPKLRGICRRTWYLNQLHLDRLKPALERVGKSDVDALVVGSWEFPICYYRDLGLRAVSELNLLVRPPSVGRAARALREAGWTGPMETSESFLRSRHCVRFEGVNGAACVLSWRLFHEFVDPARGREPEDLWEPSIVFSLGGVEARALCPTDELLNVCVSGARASSWPTITWLVDAMAVLRASDSAIDWARFVRQARRLHTTSRALDATSFLRQELGAPIPSHVLEELQETPVRRRERLAHRAAAARWPLLGVPPETLPRFLRLTAAESVSQALAHLPVFLRDEWGLERRSQVPFTAAKKALARLAARRTARGAETVRSRVSPQPEPDEGANLTE